LSTDVTGLLPEVEAADHNDPSRVAIRHDHARAVADREGDGAAVGCRLGTRLFCGRHSGRGVACATALHAKHSIRGWLFHLGEYVDRTDLVAENVSAKLAVAALLGQTELDVHVSVDPTQIGYSFDPAMARRNAFTIAEAVHRAACNRPGVHALMLDMEDQSVVDATIALHDAIKSAGLPAALTLQAYLRRTEADIRAQIRRGTTSPGQRCVCCR